MAFGNVNLVPTKSARRLVALSRRIDSVAASIPDGRVSIAGRTGLSSRLARRYKQWMTHRGSLAESGLVPDYFVLEAFNPGPAGVAMTFTIANPHSARQRRVYQTRIDLHSGFNRIKIDFQEIARQVDTSAEIHLSINPNVIRAEQEGLLLYFGLATFVRDTAYVRRRTAVGVKVVVWDLDNTVWDGVLVESGPDGVTLKPGIADVIRELDRRGIVNSVASKNDEAHAMARLRALGLADYFVFPKIGWGPKSGAIAQLIEDFNVGADTLAFVDDSEFERAQVAAVHPQVRVYTDTEYQELLAKPEFNSPQSAESSKRRAFYRSQGQRRAVQEAFSGDYLEFLRQCAMKLEIDNAPLADLDRVHELVQRTNQMNFSGSRYSREELQSQIDRLEIDHFCLHASDRFGDYGMVGFCLVDNRVPRIVDLMFSCRVQAKRVEHAFLEYLKSYYRSRGHRMLQARYVRTARNKQVGMVFQDLAFAEMAAHGDETIYSTDTAVPPLHPDIVMVGEARREASRAADATACAVGES
jgi:FkbH-like protein